MRRVLFVTLPGHGHVFPIIPAAWAARAAGHSVLVATCGVGLDLAMRAGLPVVDTGRGVDLLNIYHRFKHGFKESFTPFGPQQQSDRERVSAETFFSTMGDVMTDTVVQIGEEWRVDLIMHTPDAAAGPIAAAKLGIPSIFLGLGLAQTPALSQDTTYLRMTRTCERHGVTKIPSPAAWIDVAPPSLIIDRPRGWPMRFTPYTGGALLQHDMATPKMRKRIAVTLGTVIPFVNGLASLRWVIDAAQDVPAEFILLHASKNAIELGPLPKNVLATQWKSLEGLLSTCDGIIHHGGCGTTLTALDGGLPQIIVPEGADQFYNAAALAKRGAAIVPDKDHRNANIVQLLLSDGDLRSAAWEIRTEIRNMPPPANIIHRLSKLGLL